MEFYEFGNSGNPTIMCLPGNFMTHRQFENLVPVLEKDYHIITVSFDGYDETGERGVYLVTVADTAQAKFIPLAAPRFYDWEAQVLSDPTSAVLSALPPVGNDDFYRITLTGECAPFDLSKLQFPQFPNLQLRDRTVPPADLWGCIGEDTLEGNFFRMLHDTLEEDAEIATLAAKISRKILDGQEVVLP